MDQLWIAFLRAINVGGHTVKMDALRGLFEALALTRVETFIASGNVIFQSPQPDAQALEQQIEAHLKTALGYPVTTFLRSPADLAAVVAHVEQGQAFPNEAHPPEGTGLYIAFFKAPVPPEAQEKVRALQTPFDEFHFYGREMYWLPRKRVSESPFSGAVLEKTIKMPATLRNLNTVKKLAEKYAGG